MEKEIGKIQKGEYQGTITEIVVGIKEYNGKIGVDIREFTQSEAYTGPTKKGLRIPADKFDDFKVMINSISPEDMKEPVKSEQALSETEPKETDSEDAGIGEDGLM
jgi:hypothetical protein